MWQKARDLGFGNVTEALLKLERLNAAAQVPEAGGTLAVPEGWRLVPERMELLPEDIAVIMFHCGGDEDATEIDEQFQGGLLWVGETLDDDGNKVYGLNIACIECLEEGSTPLVEFAAAHQPAAHPDHFVDANKMVQPAAQQVPEGVRRLREALDEAAQSLETISNLSGRDEFMGNFVDTRAYANSRAVAARAALFAQSNEREG
ncbi:hypothetical protein D9M69_546740 [compost metagenome]